MPVALETAVPDLQVKSAPVSVASTDDGKAAAGPDGPNSRSASTNAHAKGKIRLLVLVVLVAGAAAAFYFWPRAGSSSSAAETTAESPLALDTFVVNLDGAGQRAYLRVGITLGLSHAPKKKDDVPTAALRDAILSVLSSEQPEQLLAAEGKEKLKADLLKALQERAPSLGIDNVYFTEFLVQM